VGVRAQLIASVRLTPRTCPVVVVLIVNGIVAVWILSWLTLIVDKFYLD